MNTMCIDPGTDHLADQAAAILLRRWGRYVCDFRVEMLPNGLILHGWTSTYYAKQLAQHAAAEAAGLPVHTNAIEVR